MSDRGANRAAGREPGGSSARRRRTLAAVAGIVGLGWLFLPGPAWPGDSAAAGVAAGEASAWRFQFAPYLWLPAVEGRTQIGAATAPIDVGFSKIFDLLGNGDLLAGGGRFEVEYDRRLAFVLDAFGGTARPSSRVTPGGGGRLSGTADLTTNWAFFEFGPAHRLLDWPQKADSRPIQIDALAGGRLMYFYERIAVRADGPAGIERIGAASTTWVDPFVGGRFSVPAGPMDILFRGDIGGFGVGSNLAWNLIGGISVPLSWEPYAARTSFVVVYKALSFDYETGTGDGARRYDLGFRGPALGLEIAF